ncbi:MULTISPECIES: DUF5129 domain-containing protein [unclassified Actinomyces]|uniref:DUF5129 domain-containing protein n=1 Tax=unclassified Actinomyces TaxID=2609248 RepID=UPI0020174D53|nr:MULTISPECIES: DUF5129 domain-containing protein [unclassified Actinomyces]MCL3777289.1 DUF5129 domain-containing protein [Actinomyces sp. AC-20-1]MCL3789578.1 DUF5129 domain-containing protein [Actinomyces sp. 187325]MCL3791863.1 DUF5129 domain-containing protein [Actinomyces sp. 186855]MCL3793651.1 DUF5129 domain-containing protein [Actinomyces sp. 217892]
MTSLGGSRSVLALTGKTAVGLLLVLLVPLMMLWPFGRTHVPQVEVHDEYGALQPAAVQDRLSELRFRQDVNLAVLTLDADYSANFNLEVLTYAREHQPQWISAEDPNYWADGLVVLAVSPSGRWVGTYFGEDVKVGTAVQEDIQDAGKGAFREGDWAGGLVDMGREAASAVGKPALARAGWLWITGALAGLAGTGSLWWAGLESRRRYRRAERHYANVTRDWDETEVLARTIPEDEPHGSQVLIRYSWFRGRYFDLTKRMQALSTVKGADWFRFRNLEATASIAQDADTLDSLDDTIAHASALLTMSSTWREAWDNELGPVYEDAASFGSLCDSIDTKGVGVSTAAQREWLRTTVNDLGRWTADLEARRVTPSAALDHLDSVSEKIRSRAMQLSQQAITADRSSEASHRMTEYKEARRTWTRSADPYAGTWTIGGTTGTYRPASTIRLNSSSAGLEGAGSRAKGTSSGVAPVAGLVTGYSSAARSSSSSSSSSSGSSSYGGGGGGFSGAGSSSHF